MLEERSRELPHKGAANESTLLMTPYELEREIRTGLAGARLVFELGIDRTRYETVRETVERLARAGRRPDDLRRSHPALYVTYLVFTGVYRYQSGTFWTEVPDGIAGPNLDPGRAFYRALRALNLETFDRIVDEEHGHPWLTRILAHGGIPISCLEPFLELLAREVAAGAPDAADLLSAWRTQHTRLTVLHQPTRRFLLYGGETAVDLLDRCIEVMRTRAGDGALPNASEAGLPQFFLDAFAKVGPDVLRHAARPARIRVPRPAVTLDPYSGLGPSAWLPPVPDEFTHGSWRVDDGQQITRSQASAVLGTAVRLVPARSYEIEFLGEQGEHRRFSFEGIERLPALLLNPETEQLVRDPVVLALDDVWTLSPPGISIRGRSTANQPVALREVQELPDPSGAWSGWQLHHYDVADVGALELMQQDKVIASIPVAPPRLRPHLDGALVDGITTADGAEVYASPPRIRIPILVGVDDPTWTVRLRCGDVVEKFIAEPDAEGLIDLAELAPRGRFSITVRGPLGSDLAATFVVVPGLEVRRPKGVVRPEHGAVEISARTDSASVSGGDPGIWTAVSIEDDATIARFTVRGHGMDTIELHAHVARLVWSIVHDTKPAVSPAAQVLRIGAEEFDDQLADIITVRTGIPGTELALELHGAAGLLRESSAVLAAGKEGRWSFDLGPFSDPIRRSSEGRLALRLLVNGWPVHVADIVARVEITRWSVTTRIADEFVEAVVSFAQERPVSGRIGRLWPQHRPWEHPIETPIADGATDVRFAGYEQLTPGPYLAEIAIADPWVTPRPPRDGSPNARSIHLGTREQFKQYMSGLDPHDPHAHLIWALSGHENEHQLDTPALSRVAGDLIVAAAFTLEDTPRDVATPAALHRVARLLDRSDRILGEAIVSAAEEDAVGAAELARLSLRLLPALEPKDEPLTESGATALWRTAPLLATMLDVPRSEYDEAAAARCETFLGWVPGGDLPDTGGALVTQAFLAMPPYALDDIRRSLGLLPSPFLDTCELQAATFEWLLRLAAFDEDDPGSPRNWYFRHLHLLREPFGTAPSRFAEEIERHIKSRLPAGTEKWAALPAVVLDAAAHIATRSRSANSALLALDEALEWAPRLVAHDVMLATVSLHDARAMGPT
jgi:hypothetical protein